LVDVLTVTALWVTKCLIKRTYYFICNLVLPGHALRSHDLLSEGEPTHCNPPYCGAGLSQALDLEVVLTPQVTLHDDQLPHGDQLPDT
jgi:hypothetical protein